MKPTMTSQRTSGEKGSSRNGPCVENVVTSMVQLDTQLLTKSSA
jgi:hypothetical protein